MNRYMNVDLEEEKILNEKPYNWKKHMLFELPETFYFVLKVCIVFGVLWLFTLSVVQGLSSTLPELCNLIK